MQRATFDRLTIALFEPDPHRTRRGLLGLLLASLLGGALPALDAAEGAARREPRTGRWLSRARSFSRACSFSAPAAASRSASMVVIVRCCVSLLWVPSIRQGAGGKLIGLGLFERDQ